MLKTSDFPQMSIQTGMPNKNGRLQLLTCPPVVGGHGGQEEPVHQDVRVPGPGSDHTTIPPDPPPWCTILPEPPPWCMVHHTTDPPRPPPDRGGEVRVSVQRQAVVHPALPRHRPRGEVLRLPGGQVIRWPGDQDERWPGDQEERWPGDQEERWLGDQDGRWPGDQVSR